MVRFSKFKILNRSTQKVTNNQTNMNLFFPCTVVNCYVVKWTVQIYKQDFIKCTLLLHCVLSFLISDTSNKCFLKIRWTPHLISSVWDELFVQATISMCACHVMSPISQSSPCFPYSEYSIRPMLIDFPIWVLYVVMLLYRTIHSSIFKNAAFCLATCPHIDCWSNFQFKI